MPNYLNRIKNKFRGLDFFDSFRHTVWYFGAELLVQGLGLASIMVYTYFLTEEEYGVVQVFLSTSNVLFILVTLNFHTSISRYYFEEKEDHRSFNGLVLVSTLGLWFVFSIVILSFRNELAALINLPVEVIPWMVILILGTIFWRFYDYYFVITEKSRLVSFSKIAVAYGRFGLSVVLFYLLAEKYYAKVVADVSVILMLSVFFIYKLYPHIKLEVKREHVRYMFLIAIPLLPHATSSFILSFFDQIMINVQLGRTETGLYSFAYKIGMLMNGFGMALYGATMADFFQKMNRKNWTSIDSQVRSFYKFLVIAAGFLILFSGEIGSVLARSKGFTQALPMVPVIVLGYFFYCLYLIQSRVIIYSKRMIYLTLLSLGAAVMNVMLNYYVIPVYGSVGAAYSTLVTFVYLFVMSWVFCKYIIRIYMPPAGDIARHVFYVLWVVVSYYFVEYVLDLGIWLCLLFKMLVFIVLALVLFGDKIKLLLRSGE